MKSFLVASTLRGVQIWHKVGPEFQPYPTIKGYEALVSKIGSGNIMCVSKTDSKTQDGQILGTVNASWMGGGFKYPE